MQLAHNPSEYILLTQSTTLASVLDHHDAVDHATPFKLTSLICLISSRVQCQIKHGLPCHITEICTYVRIMEIKLHIMEIKLQTAYFVSHVTDHAHNNYVQIAQHKVTK